MDALDVISLQNAKDWLIVQDSADNAAITRLIKSAVAWIEQYTCYRLYPRDETFTTVCYKTELPYYPINSKSVKLADGTTFDATYTTRSLTLLVTCPEQSVISLNTGYDDPTGIPPPLIEGAYKLITYLYENRDAYSTTLPLDIQILVNQFRRSPTI